MGALGHAVRSGKALHAGISSYNASLNERACYILRDMGVPCLIHQPKYNMLKRTPEGGLIDVLVREGVGGIAFCPLAATP
jgi:L-glyceraldehyde 3-phosphate reductase